MKSSHLLAILVRLFAIFLVISAIRQFSVIAQFYVHDQESVVLYPLIIAFVELVTAAILWMFPLSIAKGIVRPEIDQEISVPPMQGIMYTSITLLGLYMACNAIVDIAYWVSIRNSYSAFVDQTNPEINARLINTGIEAIIGLSLVIKAKTMAKFLTRISS